MSDPQPETELEAEPESEVRAGSGGSDWVRARGLSPCPWFFPLDSNTGCLGIAAICVSLTTARARGRPQGSGVSVGHAGPLWLGPANPL